MLNESTNAVPIDLSEVIISFFFSPTIFPPRSLTLVTSEPVTLLIAETLLEIPLVPLPLDLAITKKLLLSL